MNSKRRLLLLSLAILPLIGLTVVFAQPGGSRSKSDRGGDSRGGPGGSRGGFDPNFIFNRYSNGQDLIEVNSWIAQSIQRDPTSKERIEAFVQQQGITNGRVTRDQFAVYMQQRMASFTGAPPGTPPAPGTPAPGAAPGTPTAAAPQVDEQRIRESFNKRDENRDGILQPNEWSDSLRAEVDKYDKNKNGTIEFEEYKEYYLARMQARNDQNDRGDRRDGNNQHNGNEFQPPPPEEEKRVVYRRLSDLPKELPQWFTQVKHVNPGQIALYEWKNANMSVEEFRKYDRNADGFITVEEVLGFEKTNRSSADRRGGRGSQEPEHPMEETLLVLAGPGAISDDTPVEVVSADGYPQFGGMSSSRGGMSKGGSDRGKSPIGSDRGSYTKGSKGGPPSGNTDSRSSRDKTKGAPPSGNTGGYPSRGR